MNRLLILSNVTQKEHVSAMNILLQTIKNSICDCFTSEIIDLAQSETKVQLVFGGL